MNLSFKLLFLLIFLHVVCYGQIITSKIIGPGTGNAIIESADHNLIFCGSRSGKLLVSKIDSGGNDIWSQLFGLTTGLSPDNSGYNIIKVEDNYLITGKYDPGIGGYTKVYALLIDETGNLIWENNFGNNNSFAKNSCYDSISKVIYITGSIQNGTPDIFLIKIDTLGNTIWENTYDFGASEIGESISLKDPNNIFIIGNTTSGTPNNMFNGYLLKLDSTGVINVQKSYGGILQDNIYDFKILTDGGFLIVGTSNSFSSGNSDAWILRLDSQGDTLWTTTIGTPLVESSYSLFINDHNSIWICGKANTGTNNGDQGWLFEVDSNGALRNTFSLGGTMNELLSGIATSNNNLFSIGRSSINLNDSIFLVKLDSLSLGFEPTYTELNFEHTIFPNPTNSHVFLKFDKTFQMFPESISVYDLNGTEYLCNIEQDEHLLKITLPEFKGIYILRFRISNTNYSYKIVKN
ncbi:MAG: T9SS type A sorting domain-containing protein [Bacteroidetes bacterium]|nr:T9SS type A sorting domain-containing protein [Bacteroidota bacterium]